MTETAAFAWSIGDAARRAGVSAGTIRQWEKEGLLAPQRSRGGVRRFNESQMRRVERIAYLRNVDKLNISAIKAVLRDDRVDDPEQSPDAEPAAPSYGDHLRRLRRTNGLTLSDVSVGVGLSISYLSALERGQVGASVDTLQKILRFYGTTENAMLNTARSDRRGTLTRQGARSTVNDVFSRVATEQLLPVESSMGATISLVQPGGGSQGSYTHEGEEFIFLLGGTLHVSLEDEEYDLVTGDCLFFASTCPHSWQNVGAQPATVMWVSTPPTF